MPGRSKKQNTHFGATPFSAATPESRIFPYTVVAPLILGTEPVREHDMGCHPPRISGTNRRGGGSRTRMPWHDGETHSPSTQRVLTMKGVNYERCIQVQPAFQR